MPDYKHCMYFSDTPKKRTYPILYTCSLENTRK